ncbi:DUF982 domain-containing protein [Paracoccus cavernae]|uniref:DUF982 domain-containing protein n=1 Tax=Paracoccus cavernae TaxID=1571207 RepID=A0ABT8D7N4_9RHOB|nr:DUF982 domain-containing protein [Paracoccus cavernae]
MIEIIWGKPLTLVAAESGDFHKISTIEQAKYWLIKRWPVVDEARERALAMINGAMECMTPVQAARAAFAAAAKAADYDVIDHSKPRDESAVPA